MQSDNLLALKACFAFDPQRYPYNRPDRGNHTFAKHYIESLGIVEAGRRGKKSKGQMASKRAKMIYTSGVSVPRCNSEEQVGEGLSQPITAIKTKGAK